MPDNMTAFISSTLAGLLIGIIISATLLSDNTSSIARTYISSTGVTHTIMEPK